MRSQSAAVRAIGFSTRTCLPALRRGDGRLHMVVDMRDDADCLDGRVGQEVVVVLVVGWYAEALFDFQAPLLLSSAEGAAQLHRRQVRCYSGVYLSEEAQADNAVS